MHLQFIDWIIVAFILLICFGPALYYRKRSGKNTSEFFASGRAVPWRLAGRSLGAARRRSRSFSLGFFFNCIIMATVNLAACKIAAILFGLDRWQTLLFVGLLNVVFAALTGLWGVLVIDMIQFFVKMH